MDLTARFQDALAAHRGGRLEEAERAYLDVVAHAEHPPSLHNLGVISDARGRIPEAGGWYARAAAAAPRSAERQAALGVHLRTIRDFAGAEAAYRRALALDPDSSAAMDLGLVLLAQGRYPEGFALHETRAHRRKMMSRFSTPEWKGEPLAGKRLFVWRDEGYGDQIMMARFLPRLGAREVIYAGPAALERLFGPLGVTYQVVEGPDAVIPPHDAWLMSMSLPHRLGVTLQTVPGEPYLFGQARPCGGRIGVAVEGQPSNRNNVFRSLPPEAAARLLALPGAISLDPAATGARDFQDTADIIMGLDVVITVDTSVAHLAGALGRPVWVLLARHALDWQWPREGYSAWYPSARLFSQETPGDWDAVIDRVEAALAHS